MIRSFILAGLCVLSLGVSAARADEQSGEYQAGDRVCQWGYGSYSWDQGRNYYSWNQCRDTVLDCYDGQSYSNGSWHYGEEHNSYYSSSRWEYCTNGYYNSCYSYSYTYNGEINEQPEQCYSFGEKPQAPNPSPTAGPQ